MNELVALATQFKRYRDRLANTFRESVLDIDVGAVRTQFIRGGLAHLSRQYRAARKLLTMHLVRGKVTDDVTAQLKDVEDWKHVGKQLAAAEKQHANAIGNSYRGVGQTDLEQLQRNVQAARHALHVSGGRPPLKLVERMTCDFEAARDEHRAQAARLARNCAIWRDVVTPRHVELNPAWADIAIDQFPRIASERTTQLASIAHELALMERESGRRLGLAPILAFDSEFS